MFNIAFTDKNLTILRIFQMTDKLMTVFTTKELPNETFDNRINVIIIANNLMFSEIY